MRERGKGRAERGSPGFKRSGLDGQLVRSDGAGVTPAVSTQRKRGEGGGDDADKRAKAVSGWRGGGKGLTGGVRCQ
jgi:hypothetical protein